MKTTETSKPIVNMKNVSDNIFVVAGVAVNALRKTGQQSQADEMWRRVMTATSYNEALNIVQEHVEIRL